MRKILLAAVAAAVLAAAAPAYPSGPRLSLVRVRVSSPAEAALVAGTFDETHNRVPGHVEILLWPGDGDRLAALGLGYEVVESDVVARDLRELSAPGPVMSLPGPDRSDYRRLADYEAEMRELAERHPRLVRLIELPHATLEGRTVLGVEIAKDVRRSDGRPTFYLDGVHHAREWPAGEYPMIFAHHLVEGFGKNAGVTRVVRRIRTLIVPVVNPDGFNHSREAATSQHQTVADNTWPLGYAGVEGYWRKNRRSFSGATVPVAQHNPDAHGVDPNRNYGFNWGDNRGGSSGSEVDQTYRGSAPFSEPETQNVRELLLRRNVTSVVTNHTYSDLVLRPWGDTRDDTPDEKILRSLGARMASAMGGYRNIKSIDLYATTGTTQDWAYGALGALSYTFEHGRAFHPRYEIVADAVPGVMKAFMLGAEAAARQGWNARITGRAVGAGGRGVPARLDIVRRFSSPQWPDNAAGIESVDEVQRMTSRANGDGRFTWFVAPSTRPHIEAAGKTEKYTLIVSAGGRERRIPVRVGRDERVDLGTIRL